MERFRQWRRRCASGEDVNVARASRSCGAQTVGYHAGQRIRHSPRDRDARGYMRNVSRFSVSCRRRPAGWIFPKLPSAARRREFRLTITLVSKRRRRDRARLRPERPPEAVTANRHKERQPAWPASFLFFSLESHSHIVVADRDHVAGLAIDFHVLPVEWPVPRRLQDCLRLGISQDDRRLIIHSRINFRLDLLGHRGHRDRPLPVHQPGHQIGAVAAEIDRALRHRSAWDR